MTAIVLDETHYPRRRVDSDTVDRYAELMEDGVVFPPVIIERDTGVLLDGWHRTRAAEKAGVDLVPPDVHTVPEGMSPLLYAARLNATHGLPMSERDREELCRTLYQTPKPDGGERSITDVAEETGYTRQSVSRWLADLAQKRQQDAEYKRRVRDMGMRLLAEAGWTQQRIADHYGVDRVRVTQIVSGAQVGGTYIPSLVWAAVGSLTDTIDVSPQARKLLGLPDPTPPAQPPLPDPTPPPHVSNNSGNNEWYTPARYIEAAQRAFRGTFDSEDNCLIHDDYDGCGDGRAGCTSILLDPASSELANRTVRAAEYFTAEHDGLTRDWHGTVWLNPPYSGDLVGRFIDKTIEEVAAGRVRAAIVLVNNATETKWGQKLLAHATAVCFPSGRIRYLTPDGEEAKTPLQGQMICFLTSVETQVDWEAGWRSSGAYEPGDGPDWPFTDEFADLGAVFQR